jgi:hypothetical protein
MGDHEEADHTAGEHSHAPQRRPDTRTMGATPSHRSRRAPRPRLEGAGAAVPAAAGPANAGEATGTDLVIALGLAMVFGALGGVLLRFGPLE